MMHPPFVCKNQQVKREDLRMSFLPFFTQHKKQINLSLLGTIATVYNPPWRGEAISNNCRCDGGCKHHTALPLAITGALFAEVIPQERSQYEILFGRQFIQRTIQKRADNV